MSQLFASGGQGIGVLTSDQSFNEYSGLISLRIDWLDLLAVQGILKSLLQHHSSKASILWCSAFFMVQLSHPYMTTGKTMALIIWTFDGKVMSWPFNMLSRFFRMISVCLEGKPFNITVIQVYAPTTSAEESMLQIVVLEKTL